jgi:hypothetical protein
LQGSRKESVSKELSISCGVASNTRSQVEMYRRATNYRDTRFNRL